MGSEGVIGAEEDRGAAIYLMLDGQDTTGIGYMAVWGFGAKCWSGVDGLDGYPLDSYDYQSTCGAKKVPPISPFILSHINNHLADLASPIWSSFLQEKYFAFTLKNYDNKERLGIDEHGYSISMTILGVPTIASICYC